MESDTSDLMTTAELAERLKVSPVTITNWVRRGRIPAHRLGHKVLRYRVSEVLNALRHAPAASGEGVEQ